MFERLVVMAAPHYGVVLTYMLRHPLQLLRWVYVLFLQPRGLAERGLTANAAAVLNLFLR
jgi:hypothetical protein